MRALRVMAYQLRNHFNTGQAELVHGNPGDLFFEFVEELQDKTIVWGVYKGPVAPDPLKLMNRTLDKWSRLIPGSKQIVLDPLRKVGDVLGNIFGW